MAIPPLAVPTAGWLLTRRPVLGRITIYEDTLWGHATHHMALYTSMTCPFYAT